MPVLNLIQGELLGVFLDSAVGVVMEKWYVSWWSMIANSLNTIVIFMTIDLEPASLLLLLIYVGLGIVSASKRLDRTCFPFGSKTYAGMTLALGMQEIADTRN